MSGGTIFPSEYCPGGHVKGGTSHTVTPSLYRNLNLLPRYYQCNKSTCMWIFPSHVVAADLHDVYRHFGLIPMTQPLICNSENKNHENFNGEMTMSSRTNVPYCAGE